MRLNNLMVLRIVIAIGTAYAQGPVLHGAAQPWFEPNRGQMAGSVGFLVRVAGYAVAFHEDGSATYVLSSPPKTPEVIHMRLLGAQPLPSMSGDGALASFTRYYRGEPDASAVEVPHFSGISYHDIYPGTDLLWYARGEHLEYEFQLAAGADPNALQIGFAGQKCVEIDGNGDLVVAAGSGKLRYRHPEGWQEIEGRRVAIEVGFRVKSGVVGFEVGSYDSKRPLRIDPVLEFSTYLGGSGFDAAYAVATDSAGNVYTTGETASFDFPSSGGGVGVRSTRAVFITKLSADGSQVLFTTILASTGNDSGRGLALDNSGNIWVTGIAGAPGFPATANALNRGSNGGQDAFVARLDPTGRLSYATYLGGSGTDAAMGIAVDASGVYVTGYTGSTNFPATPGAPQTSFQGGFYDAFLLKLDLLGTRLMYSTLLGGSGNDTAAAIAVDATGDACIAGRTDSPSLPLRNAIQPSYRGNGDILLGCLNPSGTAWNLLTYLGGSGNDEANAIALDPSGNIYLTGDTFSPNFPVSAGAYQMASHGDYDAFAVKLNATGSAIVFATLLGGSGSDSGTAISVGSSGTVWIAGYTTSVNFPATAPPGFGGYFDGFVAELGSDGASLHFASYVGGSGDDRCLAMVLSTGGEAVMVGLTGSVDFPTTAGVVQFIHPTPYNAFVSRLKLPRPVVVSVSPSSGSGTTSTFSFVFSDSNGASDLTGALALINSGLSGPGSCDVQVDPAHRYLWLLNDGATAWLAPITLGVTGTVENSQCTVNGAASSVVASGNTLTVNLALSFQAGFAGGKQVYGNAVNAGGLTSGWTSLGTWTVPAANQLPQVVSVAPSSGSGSSHTFSLVYSDPYGSSDLTTVQALINTTLSGPGSCDFYIDPAHGYLYLLNDGATGWLGPLTLGAAGTVQNSQCVVSGLGSSVIASGNTLTVNVVLTFQAGFAGAKTVFANAINAGGLSSGWTALGTWTVPTGTQLPQAVSVAPSSGSGSSHTFSLVYSDPYGSSDLTTVQALINTTLSGPGSCDFYIDPVHGYLYLLNDGATGWLGPLTLGAAGGLQNSQCTISGPGSGVASVGNTVTVSLALGFQAGFAGAKSVYGNAITATGLSSGWVHLGTWSAQ